MKPAFAASRRTTLTRLKGVAALISLGVLPAPAIRAQLQDVNPYRQLIETGTQRLRRKDFRGAREAFEDALRHTDGEVNAHLGLGIACFNLRDDRCAERSLGRAIDLRPDSKLAHETMAVLHYRREDLASAITSWEKALAIDPADTALASLLERRRREYQAERAFDRDAASHFTVKYEGREMAEAGRIVHAILEEAYGEIGRALSHFPGEPIEVILYSRQQFRAVTDGPAWSGGLFDGKIRLPVGGIDRETPGLRRVLFHEYTHAVVHAIARRVPVWLHEGLAEHFGGREIGPGEQAALRQLAARGGLPSLRALEGPFRGMGSEAAGMAYLLSLAAVRYLVEHHGVHRIRLMLDALAAGASTASAAERAFHLRYEDLDRGWQRALE